RAPGDFRLLDALARVQDRMEDRAGARKTLGAILAIRPAESVYWQCVALDRALERWETVLDDLRQIRSRFAETPWLRLLVIEALGKLGRDEELLQEVDRFDTEPALRALVVGPLLGAAWSLQD